MAIKLHFLSKDQIPKSGFNKRRTYNKGMGIQDTVVLSVLKEKGPLTARSLARLLHEDVNRVYDKLGHLQSKGEIEKSKKPGTLTEYYIK